jgi:hypothetical protein
MDLRLVIRVLAILLVSVGLNWLDCALLRWCRDGVVLEHG